MAAGDVFVAKIHPRGVLQYYGYIGGSNIEGGFDIAVDSYGNAYVTGVTASDETTFPVLDGPILTFSGGGSYYNYDGFVARINSLGTNLDYCGYVGGDADDWPFSVAVDDIQNAYIAGWTSSTQTSFPLLLGPDLTYNGGNVDAFIIKISPP